MKNPKKGVYASAASCMSALMVVTPLIFVTTFAIGVMTMSQIVKFRVEGGFAKLILSLLAIFVMLVLAIGATTGDPGFNIAALLCSYGFAIYEGYNVYRFSKADI